MSNSISIVIIAKDEEHIIGKTLTQAVKMSDDVIFIDSGSIDNTLVIVKKFDVKVYSLDWQGYGPTKNYGASKAKYDWILSLDADEVADQKFVEAILAIKLDRSSIYEINIATYFTGKKIRNSFFSPMWRIRLYHKEDHKWNNNLVHEKLTNINGKKTQKIRGTIQHFSYKDEDHQIEKLDQYARKQASQWIIEGKSPNFLKRNFGALARFVKHYFFHFGFLYGNEGLRHAVNEFNLINNQIKYFKGLKG